jgi:hypothetical protein
MRPNVTAGLTVAVLALALVIGGLGAGIALSGREGPPATSTIATTSTVTTTATGTNSSSPFVLTLVISINNVFNSTAGTMPAFYVLGPNGLQSSASISVPAHRQIKLVIVNYDDGNASMVQSGVNTVSGIPGNTVLVENNDNINSSQGMMGIVVKGGQNVSSVDPMVLAHTFSVPTLNLNVPIEVSSIIVAYFTINQPGTYTWDCLTLCGDAAMSTPGWMTGSLVAS